MAIALGLSCDLRNTVFPHLDACDLARCSQVCKLWQEYASADQLWIKAIPEISEFAEVDVKKFIC